MEVSRTPRDNSLKVSCSMSGRRHFACVNFVSGMTAGDSIPRMETNHAGDMLKNELNGGDIFGFGGNFYICTLKS